MKSHASFPIGREHLERLAGFIPDGLRLVEQRAVKTLRLDPRLSKPFLDLTVAIDDGRFVSAICRMTSSVSVAPELSLALKVKV